MPPSRAPLTVGELLAGAEVWLALGQTSGPIGLDRTVPQAAVRQVRFPEDLEPRRPIPGAVLVMTGAAPPLADLLALHPPLIAFCPTRDLPGPLLCDSRRYGIHAVASLHGEHLLSSRLMGLLREKVQGEKTLHGCLVNVHGRGVLILGESGVGKTRCALALAARGHGWVADDRVRVMRKGRTLQGQAPEAIRELVAIRGSGIIPVCQVPAIMRRLAWSAIDLAVLLGATPGNPGGKTGDDAEGKLLGLPLPFLSFPPSLSPEGLVGPIEEAAACFKQTDPQPLRNAPNAPAYLRMMSNCSL